MGSCATQNKTKIKGNDFKICDNCNPKKYLIFNFAFCKEVGEPAQKDSYALFKKIIFLSSELYKSMIYKYQGNKKIFLEDIATNKIKIKIPDNFRENNPVETNEKFSIFRLYSAGVPKGSANPRVIGMIRNTIFYVFYIDWQGKMYDHN